AQDTTGRYFGGIQLGPDGRIYVSRSPYGNGVISAIQNPKRKGSACNFVSDAIDLQGRYSRFGFPNFIQTWFDLPHFSMTGTGNAFEYLFTLQDDSNIDGVLWNFGDPGSSQNTSTDFQPSHVFSSEGTYEVSVTEYADRTAYGPYTETIVIPSTSGIDDAVDVSGFCKVYPNPGNGDLRIVFDESQKRVMISVKNSLGHHLLGPVSYNNLAEDSEVFLDISELGNGIFFILFQNEEGDYFTIKYLLREE
ncbi:MAG: T9SS type A sorting domain-containing protein, partial [Bacteroidales bacterium]|nr:T9SS type A sorting domain-containing protein [Bacteroidales bacterium]